MKKEIKIKKVTHVSHYPLDLEGQRRATIMKGKMLVKRELAKGNDMPEIKIIENKKVGQKRQLSLF